MVMPTDSYFEVEPRFVDLSDGVFVLTPEGAIPLVDENTIAVVAMCDSLAAQRAAGSAARVRLTHSG
jgi:hypothetical protein